MSKDDKYEETAEKGWRWRICFPSLKKYQREWKKTWRECREEMELRKNDER